MEQNPQFTLASEYLHYTNKNIFLTGKAGTGKTTFLRQLKKSMTKRMVVVAPTGIAAINAGGSTIHSFFQLPFGPYIPSEASQDQKNFAFNKEKVQLIRTLDLLVIDEISMVRADTLDSIDQVLRQYKSPAQPFGGVQLLLIGDLFQLSPVVKEEEWQVLRPYYNNLFFFSSRALRNALPITIELQHIYRQTDQTFITILNKIRENQIDAHTLALLNNRYQPVSKKDKKQGAILLTTHNTTAQNFNEQQLEKLTTRSWQFEATITGDFPTSNFPTDEILVLKKGAQVMFIKNDPSRDKLYYNGKIGIITSISGDQISVLCQGDYTPIEVLKTTWFQTKYALNTDTKEIEEQIVGQFEQYPLKLAWAITIHKSQGLTFENVVIDASASFAHGQVYVALSRCRSLEGLTLSSPITAASIKMDTTVTHYLQESIQKYPNEEALIAAKIGYERLLLNDLFDFTEIQLKLRKLLQFVQAHSLFASPALIENCTAITSQAYDTLFTISRRFQTELTRLSQENIFIKDNLILQERVQKACSYFISKLDEVLYTPLQEEWLAIEHTSYRHQLALVKDDLLKSVFVKVQCLLANQEQFETLRYLKSRNKAELDYQSHEADEDAIVSKADLYDALKKWRDDMAAHHNVLDYMIMPMKVITEIVTKRPSSIQELANIKGIGKAKAKKFGLEILEIIVSCQH